MRVKTFLKWLLIGLGGIVGIALLGVAVIYVLLGSDLRRTFDVAGNTITVPGDMASIAEGERLTRLRGCNNGCHGKTTTGGVLFELPDGTRVVAPDLPRAVREYSIEDLERLIRHGVKPDGTSVILVMPSEMFYNLSDKDLGSIIAFLKSQEPGEVELPGTIVGPLGRLLLFFFKQMVGTVLAAEVIDHDAPRIDSSTQGPLTHGRYLALTVCSECHGSDLRGAPDGSAPNLMVAASYSIENFEILMRTGVPIGDRELDLMASVAVRRFSNFTDEEIGALHTYLKSFSGED
jgi:mono/diheme cytochrome c family protein